MTLARGRGRSTCAGSATGRRMRPSLGGQISEQNARVEQWLRAGTEAQDRAAKALADDAEGGDSRPRSTLWRAALQPQRHRRRARMPWPRCARGCNERRRPLSYWSHRAGYEFWCPGCGEGITSPSPAGRSTATGAPTFDHSVLVRAGTDRAILPDSVGASNAENREAVEAGGAIRFAMRAGQIRSSAIAHAALAGQTVPLPEGRIGPDDPRRPPAPAARRLRDRSCAARRVEVPVPVPCVAAAPAVNSSRTPTRAMTDYQLVVAMWRDRLQRRQYEAEVGLSSRRARCLTALRGRPKMRVIGWAIRPAADGTEATMSKITANVSSTHDQAQQRVAQRPGTHGRIRVRQAGRVVRADGGQPLPGPASRRDRRLPGRDNWPQIKAEHFPMYGFHA